MSRMLKPVAAGLAISSLSLYYAVELPAQNTGKKKSAVKQAQALDEAPPAGRSAASGGGEAPREGLETPLLRIPRMDEKVEAILKEWELHTAQFQKLSGEFNRFKYDYTFEIEKRATGKFAFEAPDKGNYELRPVEIKKGAVSKKLGKTGQPFALQPDTPERWVCSGKEIIKIDEKEKTYENVVIPPEKQGERIIDGPLPFLFGMKAERAKQRYKEIKLLKRTEEEIWLEILPREKKDAENWMKATIIIDAKTFVPKAVQLTDPTGAEMVHRFTKVEINPRKPWFGPDPFKPNLNSYKLVLDSKQAAGGGRGQRPAGGKASATTKDDQTSLPETFEGDADRVAAEPQSKKIRQVNRK